MTHLEKCKIITNKMKALGLDTSHLDEIQEELSILERPWLSKIKYSVKKHYSHLKGEMFESLEMTSLLRKGVNNLSPKERQKIKSQLLDVAKILPAGFIAATNAILPIPFTSVLTPILLQKWGSCLLAGMNLVFSTYCKKKKSSYEVEDSYNWPTHSINSTDPSKMMPMFEKRISPYYFTGIRIKMDNGMKRKSKLTKMNVSEPSY